MKNGSSKYKAPWGFAAAAMALVLAPTLAHLDTALAQPAGPHPAPSASASAAPKASATPSASAAMSASAAPPAAPPPTATATLAPSPAPAPVVPKLPDPTADQIAALAALQNEADQYEKDAKDYRGAITKIVQHHYEEERRRILGALDRELDIEKKGLVDAREEAIRRLEAFVARYSGPNAHPEETPDAMFRLAALYEEKVRADADDPGRRLEPAIALYKDIINKFPKYRELAAVYYYLGHALNDSNRAEEAQQVWRSLVCHNQYAYPVEPDPADKTRDTVKGLPQDHDAAYWKAWESRHPVPFGKGSSGIAGGGKHPAPARPAPVGKKGGGEGDETSFQNPFPDSCVPIPQKTLAGQEPRYIGEVWWLIGDYYFNEVSPSAGPFGLNRAQVAYTQSLKFKKPPVYGVSMYKLAWTYFKQQRYKMSVGEFVELLKYADEQEKLTGDPGSDFRAEAFTYIAGSLTYLDFDGPDADEPYIPRNDVLDTETDPKKAEKKMHIAIDRVQDPSLIPQDQKWTVDIYKALAQEFRELNQYHNTIDISEIILQKWPMDCDAPVVQNQIAETYDTLMRQSREGTAEYSDYSQKALEARTKLASYVGLGPWTQNNKDRPECIETAEKLVKGGLRRAAADHTNAGRALANKGIDTSEKADRDPIFERALKEYQLAAQGWEGYLAQDPNAPDAYESRFWLADANHMIVVLTVALERSPTPEQIAVANKTAIDVRDSNESDKYLQPSAVFVVDISHQQLLDAYRRFKASSGSDGIEERDGIKLEGSGDNLHYTKEPVPPAVLAAVQARDDYIKRVPIETEPDPKNPNHYLYAFDAANYYFDYGQFDEAKKRFEPIYKEHCGKDDYGFKAWDRLRSMANLDNNVAESQRYAEEAKAHSCAISDIDKNAEKGIITDTLQKGFFIQAAKDYDAADKMAPGPERDKMWRKAAKEYKDALTEAPGRKEAPEAAIYGARAYKNVGEYDEAIGMYDLFIKNYGNDDKLTALEKGDKTAKPPVDPDPTEYKKRVDNLLYAYNALSASYVLFFNYQKAADTFDIIAKNKRFAKDERKKAARNAVDLYANAGDDAKMLAARDTLYGMDPSGKEKADIDFMVASADLKRWDENGKDDAANRTARQKAQTSMEAYYTKNKGNADAQSNVIEAAYDAAKTHRAGNDAAGTKTWCGNTISAFSSFKAKSTGADGKNTAMGSAFADMAAECAYRDLDAQLKDKWDYDTGHHRYKGVIDKVKEAFDKDVNEANDNWFKKLDDIVTTYASKPWSVAVRSRQGSLYDSCRTGLYNLRLVDDTTHKGDVELYTDKEKALFTQVEQAADGPQKDQLLDKVDAIRSARMKAWHDGRQQWLATADKAMVRFYTESVVWGRAYKVRNDSVDRAIRRLAFFTDILGDKNMGDYAQGVVDPETKQPFVYQDGIWLKSRPGLSPPLTPNGLPAPLPAAQ